MNDKEQDDNEQETSEIQLEDCALKSNACAFASRSKAQTHKDVLLPAHPQKLYLLGRQFGPMLNQENIQSLIMIYRRNWCIFFVMHNTDQEVSKKLIHLLRHGSLQTAFFTAVNPMPDNHYEQELIWPNHADLWKNAEQSLQRSVLEESAVCVHTKMIKMEVVLREIRERDSWDDALLRDVTKRPETAATVITV